ncbi:unnamed protein product [Cyclocybe aegerita]|uniref:Uncharacterized protein n=1 Tax=Cyclocybe aegerita TaxID=1973307 RepID=A0A8S0WBV4_CYCAE|nr:unnamed protein product [Cyclocybe aegerita]
MHRAWFTRTAVDTSSGCRITEFPGSAISLLAARRRPLLPDHYLAPLGVMLAPDLSVAVTVEEPLVPAEAASNQAGKSSTKDKTALNADGQEKTKPKRNKYPDISYEKYCKAILCNASKESREFSQHDLKTKCSKCDFQNLICEPDTDNPWRCESCSECGITCSWKKTFIVRYTSRNLGLSTKEAQQRYEWGGGRAARGQRAEEGREEERYGKARATTRKSGYTPVSVAARSIRIKAKLDQSVAECITDKESSAKSNAALEVSAPGSASLPINPLPVQTLLKVEPKVMKEPPQVSIESVDEKDYKEAVDMVLQRALMEKNTACLALARLEEDMKQKSEELEKAKGSISNLEQEKMLIKEQLAHKTEECGQLRTKLAEAETQATTQTTELKKLLATFNRQMVATLIPKAATPPA